jgi:hypothetical protein
MKYRDLPGDPQLRNVHQERNMENLRTQINRPMTTGIVAFIAGLLIGLVILGWWIWPVQWSDAAPQHLRQDLQEDYLRMALDSYARTPDLDLAKRVIDGLGKDNAVKLLAVVNEKYKGKLDDSAVKEYSTLLGIGVEVKPTETTTGKSAPINLTVVLALMCLLTVVIGAILVYLFFFRGRGVSTARQPAGVTTARSVAPPSYPDSTQEPPVVQYLTTYSLGNDLYDDSFSIDSPTGEFLGECGVGISETIGVGDPKKVTAFEVWLFDKNDIQTVTKVLMSGHAFNDPVVSQRLASKGEPVQAEGGKRVTLETATLTLEARVVSMNYGQGALPQNSFFDQMTLELAVWPKKTAG